MGVGKSECELLPSGAGTAIFQGMRSLFSPAVLTKIHLDITYTPLPAVISLIFGTSISVHIFLTMDVETHPWPDGMID